MKEHDVHLYASVRVKVKGVKAEDHPGAITLAEQRVDLHELFRTCDGRQGCEVEYAEEITYFLVDERGDKEFKNSTWYEKDGETPTDSEANPRLRLTKALTRLLEYVDSCPDAQAEEDPRVTEARALLALEALRD